MPSSIRLPLILVNFKTYAEATGNNALKLAKIAREIELKTDVCIAISPQFTDIARIVREVNIPVFAQHVDPISFGSYTGHVLPEAVKEAGASGTIINHFERRLKLKDIYAAVTRAEDVGLTTVVCGDVPKKIVSIAKFNPTIVAFEPPELIGTGIPVSRAKPEIVKSTVELVRKISRKIVTLCGAGITSKEDVVAALKLGTQGVLISSGIVRARDQYTALLNLAEAIKTI